MLRYAMLVGYRGTAYCGWQRQLNGDTIQARLEDALALALRQKVTVAASGRTDAGVHALGQVAAFTFDPQLVPAPNPQSSRGPEPDYAPGRLRARLTGVLPGDIAVHGLTEVGLGFDPRRDAVAKHYRYRVVFGHSAWPSLGDWQARVPFAQGERFEVARVHEVIPALLGEHDFASFMLSGSSVSGTVRVMHAVEVSRWACEGAAIGGAALGGAVSALDAAPHEPLAFDFVGSGFLRGQVRAMASVLLEAGFGRLDRAGVNAIVAARDRRAAPATAPASGLCLVGVRYREGAVSFGEGGVGVPRAVTSAVTGESRVC